MAILFSRPIATQYWASLSLPLAIMLLFPSAMDAAATALTSPLAILFPSPPTTQWSAADPLASPMAFPDPNAKPKGQIVFAPTPPILFDAPNAEEPALIAPCKLKEPLTNPSDIPILW